MVVGYPLRASLVVVVAVATMMLGASPGDAAAGSAGPHESTSSPSQGQPLTVGALLAATPPGSPDSDHDGLPDSVEAVLGTMADEPDSDLDGLDDYYELDNGLDPRELDTNNDGLPDGLEVDGPADVDGDGIPNAIDDDNDNDGVIDGLDLSPFAVSATATSITVDVTSGSEPTYLDFQVIPDDGQMSLTGQQWNWPADEYGTIQDLDDIANEADIQILPMIELTTAAGPEAGDVVDYGIVPMEANEAAGDDPDSWKGLVPLTPVIDHTGTAALSGRMFFPEGTSGMITARMVWVVVWIDPNSTSVAITDHEDAGQIAGGQLVNLTKGAGCVVRDLLSEEVYQGYVCNEPLPGGAIFEAGDQLRYTYTQAGMEHSLETEVARDTPENSGVLARHATPFVLTGLAATANHGAKAAVLYGDGEQVVATGVVLSYEYLRGTDDLATVVSGLDDYDITDVESISETGMSHLDLAYETAANELLPEALGDLPDAATAPVLLTFEDDSTTKQPTEWDGAAPAPALTNLTIDLTDPHDRVVTRSMRLDWYDPTTGDRVDNFIPAIEAWGLDDATFEAVALLAAMWDAGDALVVKAGGDWVSYAKPEWYELSKDISDWVKRGFSVSQMSVKIGMAFDGALSAYRFVKGLRAKGWSVSLKAKPLTFLRQFGHSYRGVNAAIASSKVPWSALSMWGKIGRGLVYAGRVAAVVGALIIIGFVAYVWATEGLEPAMWELSVAGFTALAIWLAVEIIGGLVEVGPIGWAILAVAVIVLVLGEIFGGWISSVWNWLVGLTTPDVSPLVNFDVQIDDGPNITVLDPDDNGFDIGDELLIDTDFLSRTEATRGDTYYTNMIWSGIDPRLAIETCALHPDESTTCMPATGAQPSEAIIGDEAELYTSQWQAEDERWYHPAELVQAGATDRCDSIVDWSSGDRCWIDNLSHTRIRLIPKMATTELSLDTGVAYSGYVYVYVDYSWPRSDAREQRTIEDDGTDNRQPMYFDVLPGSLADLLAWPALTALDDDRDGVANVDDDAPTDPDRDGDGLDDGYELGLGTEPGVADTDGDGLDDAAEVWFRTDPLTVDTDGDGLSDGAEIAAHSISFTYRGSVFTTSVTSDPTLADADNDTLTDADELALGTNPNAWDTDGDGYRDGANSDPVAGDDAFTTAADQVLVVAAPGLLSNDFDNESDPIYVGDVNTFGMNGEVTWQPDGSFTFDAAGYYDSLGSGESATEVFFYTTSDGRGGQGSAQVIITITGAPPPGSIFTDDDYSIFEADIEWLALQGITRGCNPPINDHFCPEESVTRGQMAAFLVRALHLTDPGTVDFIDDNNSIFQADIEKLATAGITKGCNPPTNNMYCPNGNVTRGQMAAFLVRALHLTDPGTVDFIDDNNSIFETDIEKLATAGITKGCNPPTNNMYCPNDNVTRGQMAAFMHRALG